MDDQRDNFQRFAVVALLEVIRHMYWADSHSSVGKTTGEHHLCLGKIRKWDPVART